MKRWARKSRNLIIAFKIFSNWQMRRRFASGDTETEHGSTHSRKTLAESLSYIEEQFQDYLKYGQLSNEELGGKRVLELGFGDNVGVALRFLSAGAAKVICIDKFSSKRDTAREIEIYSALREKLSPEETERFDKALDLSDGLSFDASRLSYIRGLDLEPAIQALQIRNETFDIVISRAVIEEIYDPSSLFARADQLLAPSGLMLHKIDLSDYGIFTDGGMHPLTFLTIPQSVYRLMATDSGIPNRKLIGYYREQMRQLGYDAKLLITDTVGHGAHVPHKEAFELDEGDFRDALPVINEIRPKLSGEYQSMTDEELMVRGIFLVARKPARSGTQAMN
ncbi:MAG: class I SAM-dependent methyltransferase [Acidobacteriota bacterium]|nr:class I SAM-dependent methyltransferase [Acidobacteriota bacterium]